MSAEFYRSQVWVVEKAIYQWVSDESDWLSIENDQGVDDEVHNRDMDDGRVRGVKVWIFWALEERLMEELVDHRVAGRSNGLARTPRASSGSVGSVGTHGWTFITVRS